MIICTRARTYCGFKTANVTREFSCVAISDSAELEEKVLQFGKLRSVSLYVVQMLVIARPSRKIPRDFLHRTVANALPAEAAQFAFGSRKPTPHNGAVCMR